MPGLDDQPRIWNGDDVFTDDITPEIRVELDREKMGQLGLPIAVVGVQLQNALSGNSSTFAHSPQVVLPTGSSTWLRACFNRRFKTYPLFWVRYSINSSYKIKNLVYNEACAKFASGFVLATRYPRVHPERFLGAEGQ